MADFVTAIAVYIGLWAGTTTLVWYAFKRMSEASSDVGREHATTQLTSTSWTARADSWPRAFVDGFDGIFGTKHFRWKCLWRSLLVSATVCALLALLWAALYPSHASAWLAFIQDHFNDDRAVWVKRAAFHGTLLLVVNGLGDYLSLLETRTLLRILAARTGVRVVALVLLLDVVLTTLIWLSVFGIGILVGVVVAYLVRTRIAGVDSVLGAIAVFLRGSLETYNLDSSAQSFAMRGWPRDALGPPLSIYFYSALFTSVWLWLFALSKIVVSLVGFVERIFRRSLERMDVVRKPYLAMGAAWQKILHFVFLAVLPFYVWRIWPG